MTVDMLQLDGRMGEGGGQVLRTSLALSAITGRPFSLDHIRGGRGRPGLMRQHLTCVQAATEVCGAKVTGDTLRSTALRFEPGAIRSGAWTFEVGTAGSVNLVLQTLIPILASAPGPSEVSVSGGTHNMAAPCTDFLRRTFAPALAAFGPKVDITLFRPGFYPAGGGRVVAIVEPAPFVAPCFEARREVDTWDIEAVSSGVSTKVGRAEASHACFALGIPRESGRATEVRSAGPGNVLMVTACGEPFDVVFTGFGARNKRAEDVVAEAVGPAKLWRDAAVPVDEHLADQLLIPLALAGGGSFLTTKPSLHSTTNAEVIERFLGVAIRFEAVDDVVWRVSV